MKWSVLVASCLLLPVSALAEQGHSFAFETISGNRIAWSCEGTGDPTIVLVAGGGLDAHASFGRIYHNYKGQGRICMYDRAGLGQSSFNSPKTRTLKELSAELHELSQRQKWGSAILVAHSFGGFIARAYASDHPVQVRGLLLLDVAHEDWLPRLKAKMSDTDWAIMERIVAWNTRTFHEDYVEAQESVRSMTIPRFLPITVVARGIPHTSIRVERMSYAGIDLFNIEHNELQPKLLTLSDNADYRVARYSSHVFNDSDPWLVLEELDKLIQRSAKR